jgi:hypothetical protein
MVEVVLKVSHFLRPVLTQAKSKVMTIIVADVAVHKLGVDQLQLPQYARSLLPQRVAVCCNSLCA